MLLEGLRASRRLIRRVSPGSVLLLCLYLPLLAHAELPDQPLDVVIYGASGAAGTRLLNEALRRNHRVTAVTRDTSRIVGGRRNLQIVEGDIVDADSVARITAGADVVILSVRGSIDGSDNPASTVHRVAVEQLVEVLRAAPDSQTRLLIVGGAGSLEVRPGVTYAESIPRLLRLFIPRELRREIAGHRLALAYLATVDDVPWTYVSPPKSFKPGRRTGAYQLAGKRLAYDARGRSRISMEDYAIALLDEAERAEHIHEHISVLGK